MNNHLDYLIQRFESGDPIEWGRVSFHQALEQLQTDRQFIEESLEREREYNTQAIRRANGELEPYDGQAE